MPGRPILDNSRARADCACSTCGWGYFDIFPYPAISLFFLPLSGDGSIKTKILSQRAVKHKNTKKKYSLNERFFFLLFADVNYVVCLYAL